MYPVPKFWVSDPVEVRAFVEKYPFATLVALGANGGFVATHLPLLVQEWGERMVFRGHVMRETDHGEALQQEPNVFVSFLGPDAPVLGSWQLTPRFGGTWNYQAVHVHGRVERRDRAALMEHLEILKDRFETSPAHRFGSLPPDYVQGLVPMIECIDVVVTDLKCVFKLSQNRSVEEFDRTVWHLRREGGKSALVADEMERRRARFFPQAPGSAPAPGALPGDSGERG